jgi:galactose mutarotase-like enzyme
MLSETEIRGHPAIWLENELLRISVLPKKGADIYQFIHKSSGVDFLMRTPADLQPPGEKPPVDFLDNYEGGWQELFPNPGDAYDYKGTLLPFHGEVALLPWVHTILRNDPEEAGLRLSVECHHTPFRLERVMRLRRGLTYLEIDETVTNLSDAPAFFSWGHHIVLGGDFLEDGCLLEIPARTIKTPVEFYEPATARLAAGQNEPWPVARGRNPGESFDLRRVLGPDAHLHDDIYLTDIEKGILHVDNPRLRLKFWLEWDAALFGCVVNWRPFGGADMPPLTGIYGLGIEPWVTDLGLAEAINQGKALRLDPSESLHARLLAGVDEYPS